MLNYYHFELLAVLSARVRLNELKAFGFAVKALFMGVVLGKIFLNGSVEGVALKLNAVIGFCSGIWAGGDVVVVRNVGTEAGEDVISGVGIGAAAGAGTWVGTGAGT